MWWLVLAALVIAAAYAYVLFGNKWRAIDAWLVDKFIKANNRNDPEWRVELWVTLRGYLNKLERWSKWQ